MKEKKIIWKQVRLGEIGYWKKGQPLAKTDICDKGKHLCIHYGELFTMYHEVINRVYSRTDILPIKVARIGDILFPASDVTPDGLGRCSAIMVDNVIIGGDVIALIVKKQYYSPYISFAINQEKKQIIQRVTGTTVKHISSKQLSDVLIPIPFDEDGEVDMEEQRRIAGILSDMDEEIRVKEELLAKHRALKQGVMQQLLAPDTMAHLTPDTAAHLTSGTAAYLAPDIAGEATASTHTQRRRELVRLGEICSIIRGGSPRPIEAYLTTSHNGYNWIKIGDVKVGAKYIERTEEKIIAAGLSSTRIVHKGDFILSNSMSFGRPYILKIDGCIHDGWLAIQDYNATCDTDYLYYVLSSEQVMQQYKSLAAGSSVLNLNKNIVSSVLISIPCKEDGSPDLAEQQRIAGILSDMDAEIGVQEEVIEKLKAVKQGVMQGLLNAQQRT